VEFTDLRIGSINLFLGV